MFKEGVYKGKDDDKCGEQRRQSIRRDNCIACLRLNREKGIPNWKVVKFVEVHSHDLATPRKNHLLHINRNFTSAKKILFDDLKKTNMPVGKVINQLAILSGGFDKVGCIATDMRNYVRDEKEATKDFNLALLIDYFRSLQSQSKSFFYKYRVDTENRFTNCFWVEKTSRGQRSLQIFWRYSCI